MMIGGIRGDDCEGKDWGWFSYAALSKIWCQEMGIVCVPSWISMRQKKRGWCCGCSMAEPTTEGGGEYWQPSNERMPCQKGSMIPNNKIWWHSLLPDARCSVRAMWARCSHIERKVHCSISRLCPYVGQVVMFCVNLIICDVSCLINSGQQEVASICQADTVCHPSLLAATVLTSIFRT